MAVSVSRRELSAPVPLLAEHVIPTHLIDEAASRGLRLEQLHDLLELWWEDHVDEPHALHELEEEVLVA